MSGWEPTDPAYEAKVRASFARQRVMDTLGAELVLVEPGRVEIELAYRPELSQQHGYLHAGVSATIADSAGGYAAYSLMPPGASILSVEFKVNLLAPGRGQRFRARGRVVRAGKRLTVTEIDVLAFDGDRSRTCLFGLQTCMCLPDHPDGPG